MAMEVEDHYFLVLGPLLILLLCKNANRGLYYNPNLLNGTNWSHFKQRLNDFSYGQQAASCSHVNDCDQPLVHFIVSSNFFTDTVHYSNVFSVI